MFAVPAVCLCCFKLLIILRFSLTGSFNPFRFLDGEWWMMVGGVKAKSRFNQTLHHPKLLIVFARIKNNNNIPSIDDISEANLLFSVCLHNNNTSHPSILPNHSPEWHPIRLRDETIFAMIRWATTWSNLFIISKFECVCAVDCVFCVCVCLWRRTTHQPAQTIGHRADIHSGITYCDSRTFQTNK